MEAVIMGGSQGRFVRRRLGVRLRRLRENCKPPKTTLDVEGSGVCTRMTLNRIENGRQATKPGTVVLLCQLYGADEQTTDELVAFAKASSGTGWFEAYDDVVPKEFELYLDCELTASEINIYDPEVVPGVLQTPEYAEAIFIGEGLWRAEVVRQLAARLERQERYWRDRPPGAQLCVVLSEAALAREVGGRASMSRQLDHMREIGEWDNVDIRVLPWAAGAHPAIYSGYTIFRFPDPEDPTVIYVESYSGGTYLEGERNVTRMQRVQETLYHISVPIKEHTHP